MCEVALVLPSMLETCAGNKGLTQGGNAGKAFMAGKQCNAYSKPSLCQHSRTGDGPAVSSKPILCMCRRSGGITHSHRRPAAC